VPVYSSWLPKTGPGADPRPIFFDMNDPDPKALPARGPEGGGGGLENALAADELPEYCWDTAGLGAESGSDGDGFICCCCDQVTLSRSRPFPAGVLPMSGRGFEEPTYGRE
jgi:hypothetical protein